MTRRTPDPAPQVTGNRLVVVRGADDSTAATHSNNAAVKVMVDAGQHSIPTCSYVCSTTYELKAPHECTDLDWSCGYGDNGGARRGYKPEKGTCDATCSCDNAGTAACSGTGTCACRASTNPHGTSLTSPWHTSVVRLPAGVSMDGCAGPFELCRGSNPYAGYRLVIGGQTRTIVGYSGYYKVVQLDKPLRYVYVCVCVCVCVRACVLHSIKACACM